MSKRMHIYASAIDPIRKKFGVPAKEVAGIVAETMSRNERQATQIAAYVEEINALKSAAAVANVAHDAVHTELALAQETIVDLQVRLAGEARCRAGVPTTFDFLRVGPLVGTGVSCERLDFEALVKGHPEIEAWLRGCQEHKSLGAVYDGGDFVVVCARPLGGQAPAVPITEADLVNEPQAALSV